MNRDDFVLEKVKTAVPDAVTEVNDFRGERTIFVQQEHLKEVCLLLPDFPRFAVSYHLYSIPHNHRLRLRVQVEDPDEGPETLGPVWAVATWLEMEVYDLMGVRFAGHTNMRRLFLPEDWQGHPLRKDYPLGYEEVQFSFNWEEIDAKKPYAKE